MTSSLGLCVSADIVPRSRLSLCSCATIVSRIRVPFREFSRLLVKTAAHVHHAPFLPVRHWRLRDSRRRLPDRRVVTQQCTLHRLSEVCSPPTCRSEPCPVIARSDH